MAYPKTGSRATMDGQWYEVKMAALLFLRLKNNPQVAHFRLATNLDGAGAMDDLVVSFCPVEESHKWHTRFIQLKHTQGMLWPDAFTALKGNYALLKYLKAFTDIKKMTDCPDVKEVFFDGQSTLCEFAIYTISKAVKELKEKKTEKKPLTPDPKSTDNLSLKHLLKSCSEHELVFKFNVDDDPDLFSFLEGKAETPSDVSEFLEKLTMFSGQSTQTELDEVIKKELMLYYGATASEAGQLLPICKEEFEKWWRDSNLYLHEKSDISDKLLDYLLPGVELMKQITECTFEHVGFDAKVWNTFDLSLVNGVSQLVVVSTGESIRLSATKVLRCLQRNFESHQYMFVGLDYLLRKREVLMCAWEKGNKDLLVIVSPSSGENRLNELQYLCINVNDVLARNSSKKAIVVTHQSDALCQQLWKNVNVVYRSLQDTVFEFSDLDQKSKENVFEQELILQGYQTSLKSMLKGDMNLLNCLFSDHFSEALLSRDSITIGLALPKVLPYFIPRRLVVRNHLAVDILPSRNVKDRFAVTGVTVQELQQMVPKSERVRHAGETESRQCRYVVLDMDKAMEQYDSLCQTRPDVHWLHMDAGRLLWKKSQGNVGTIERFVCKQEDTPVEADSIHCSTSRGVVLVGEPGMGKSTLMTHAADRAKKADPANWVMHIDLEKHSYLLNDLPAIGAFQFLTAGLQSPLEHALFRISLLQTGNVIVLLDGFDEICPKYEAEGSELLTRLLETRVKKVVVSSRHSMKGLLESRLSTLAFEIVEFLEQDQKSFLRRYWNQFQTTMTSYQMEEFIEDLMKSVKAISNRGRQLMGIPQHTMMLADIYKDCVTDPRENRSIKLPKYLDCIYLFEEFISRKFNKYFRTSITSLTRKRMEELFYENHFYVSLFLLLSTGTNRAKLNTDLDVQSRSQIFLNEIENGQDNAGIVSVINRKPIFIHLTFAEFFAGLWFSKHFKSNGDFIRNNFADSGFVVVRGMFDRLLAKGLELHTAVLNNDTLSVEALLAAGQTDVNSTDRGGRSALHLAATLGYEFTNWIIPIYATQQRFILGARPKHMVELLMEYGADTNLVDSVCMWIPLEYAVQSKSWDACEYLLAVPENMKRLVLPQKFIHQLFLERVISNGFINIMTQLLDNGLTLNDVDLNVYKRSPLHHACWVGEIGIVNLLLSRREDQWATDFDGNTPLHLASRSGHLSVVRALIKNLTRLEENSHLVEKYVNLRNTWLEDAMMLACKEGCSEVVRVLIRFGGVWPEYRYSQDCLCLAITNGHSHAVQTLIESLGVEKETVTKLINNRRIVEKSPFHLACCSAYPEVVRLLIAHGGDIWNEDKIGRNSLFLASMVGHLEVVRVLIESLGEDRASTVEFVNKINSGQEFPLDVASHHGFSEIVELMIRHGGDIWAKDKHGRNCLHTASRVGHVHVARILVESLGDDKNAVVAYINTKDSDCKTARTLASESLFGTKEARLAFKVWLDQTLIDNL